jgi:hypothetical protein
MHTLFPRTLLITLLAAWIASATAQTSLQTQNGSVITFPQTQLACITQDKLTNKFSPLELWKNIAICIDQEKYDAGVFMYALAGVYGRFDIQRVADQSAHQASKVLPMMVFDSGNKAKVAAFKEKIGQTLGNDQLRTRFCKDIAQMGLPDYYPTYMTQHGLQAASGRSSVDQVLVPNFNSSVAMKEALSGYLMCPR